ncbi:MAG: ATP-binding cassette domain-containing protein [Candidatus Dactylopiibacterium sp.]|nr:ATP-binding cassette domain-containing protein [Candidatus Dactylopiibacterium sp.]
MTARSLALPGQGQGQARLQAEPGILLGTWQALCEQSSAWVGLALAGLMINATAIGVSLYSMQVYDRVLPQFGTATLQVLTVGVLLALLFQLMLQKVRAALTQQMVVRADRYASRRCYDMLSAYPVEALASGSGHLASLVQGHESIRAFLIAVLSFGVIDLPFALLFYAAMAYLGGWMAAVPALIFVLLLVYGAFQHYRVLALTDVRRQVASEKLSFITETVKNLEFIQARGKWPFVARWRAISEESVDNELRTRQSLDATLHLVQFAQSAGYVFIVALGAYQAVTLRDLSSGAIVAASILGSRVLAPLVALPGLMIQGAQALLAGRSIDRALGGAQTQPPGTITLTSISGQWAMRGLAHRFPGRKTGLYAPQIDIPVGAKVAIIGSPGAGKSTLLRLFAGLIAPQQGSVYLDGMNVGLISRDSLCQHLAYLPQSPSLFAGTLRSNLCEGSVVPDDDIVRVARLTGLDALIASDERGLDLPLGECGAGLSGGQQQMLAFTRALLRPAQTYLLDEPTQSLDEATQARCLDLLDSLAAQGKTVIYATHSVESVRRADVLLAISPDGLVVVRQRSEVQHSLSREAEKS